MTTPAGATVWRKYVIDAVPASGPHAPEKDEVIAWAASLEGEVSGAMADAAAALAAAAAVAPVNNGMVLAAIPKTANVTLTLGSPGTISWTAHGQPALTPLYLTTTGALLTGLTANTTVYVTAGASLLTNSFQVSSSIANAIAGVSINFTGTQSGTHTAFANYAIPYPYKGYRQSNIIPIASSFGLTSGSGGQVWNSLTLAAGRWRVFCQSGVIVKTGTPAFTHMHSDFGVGTTNIQTSPGDGSTTALHINSNQQNGWIFPNGENVFALPSGGTINAVMTADFTGGTAGAYGKLTAELF